MKLLKIFENSIATGKIKATEAALLINWVRITVDTKITLVQNKGHSVKSKLQITAINLLILFLA